MGGLGGTVTVRVWWPLQPIRVQPSPVGEGGWELSLFQGAHGFRNHLPSWPAMGRVGPGMGVHCGRRGTLPLV